MLNIFMEDNEKLKNILDSINDNTTIISLGMICTIVPVSVSFLLKILKLFKKYILKEDFSKRLSYSCYSNRITENKFIKIDYYGKSEKNIIITNIAIWNSGNETIRNSDIPNHGKLNIRIPFKYKVEDAYLLYWNEFNSIKFEITKDYEAQHHILWLSFDYFEQGEGTIFQLVLSSQDSLTSNETYQLNGKIIDGIIISRIRRSKIIIAILFIICLFVAMFSFMYCLEHILNLKNDVICLLIIAVSIIVMRKLLIASNDYLPNTMYDILQFKVVSEKIEKIFLHNKKVKKKNRNVKIKKHKKLWISLCIRIRAYFQKKSEAFKFLQ